MFWIFVLDSVSHSWSDKKLQTSTCYVSRKTSKIGSVSNTCFPLCIRRILRVWTSACVCLSVSLHVCSISRIMGDIGEYWCLPTINSLKHCKHTYKKVKNYSPPKRILVWCQGSTTWAYRPCSKLLHYIGIRVHLWSSSPEKMPCTLSPEDTMQGGKRGDRTGHGLDVLWGFLETR